MRIRGGTSSQRTSSPHNYALGIVLRYRNHFTVGVGWFFAFVCAVHIV